jgi:XRE family aerobic/anaerobic benzoate catabolism transcriptional regulator
MDSQSCSILQAMVATGKTTDETAFLSQLGVRVRRARSRAGLTRRRLSERSGVSERYLAQLESGDGNISILLIRRVAAALGADLHELIGQRVDTGRRGRVALIGLRGAGKSTLGARLAERMGVPFFELDSEVEREMGATLESVFAMYGQDAYRDGERRALARLIEQHERSVIATGGSLVVEPQTYQLLRSRCLTVWLRATPEEHMNRVIAQGDLRPIQGREHAMTELRTILAQRERLYALADATVDTSAHDEERCLQELLTLVGELGTQAPPVPGDLPADAPAAAVRRGGGDLAS